MRKFVARYINPSDRKELSFWARQWNLKVSQIKDLLGVTGSSRVDVLENHLRQSGLLQK
jgi:predicted XRE-type DNA-binding protein